MKNWQHMIMTVIIQIFLVGCTLFPQGIKTEFVEPKAFKFVPIEVNLTEIPKVEPFDLTGKISFTDDTNASVEMATNTWVEVRSKKEEKDVECKRRGLQNLIRQKAIDGLNHQIKLYLKLYRKEKKENAN